LAITGGGSIISCAGNAAMIASSHTALSFCIARNMRVNEKLCRYGACFADNAACVQQYAGREYLSITGAVLSNTRGKMLKIIPKNARARRAVNIYRVGGRRALFFTFMPIVDR